MKVDFILVATGYVTMPQLNIVISGIDDKSAIEQAKSIIAELSNYHRFTLFDVAANHRQLATFHVEKPEPKIIVRGA